MSLKERCKYCALVNTPDNVRVVQLRKNLTGKAYKNGTLCAPRPVTRKALYVYLHECAHFALNHGSGDRKPSYIREMEAEKWAQARMREARIPIPEPMLRGARAYVRRKMARVKNPVPEALAFVGGPLRVLWATTPTQPDGRRYHVKAYFATEAEARELKQKYNQKYGVELDWRVRDLRHPNEPYERH